MLPVLFHLPGGRPVFAYGVMLGLAMLVGLFLIGVQARKVGGISRDDAGNGFLIGVVAGVIGARLAYVLVNPQGVADADAPFWEIQGGGLLGVGGLVAAAAAVWLYLRLRGASAPAFADAAVPALIAFAVLVRIGAYLSGSDFGSLLGTDAPDMLKALGTFPRWEVAGRTGPPVLLYQIDRYGLAEDLQASLPVHPVQLYGVLLGLVAALYFCFLRARKPAQGQVFVRVAILWAICALGLEQLRADLDRGMVFGFSLMQLGSMVVLALALMAVQRLSRANAEPTA